MPIPKTFLERSSTTVTMLLSDFPAETKEIEFNKPSAIAIATNPLGTKLQVNNVVNKRHKKKQQLPSYNPLLPESERLSDDDIEMSPKQQSKPTRIHPFTLITKTSQTIERKKSKFYNIYCMLLFSNIFLIGSFLLFIHNYIIDAIGILFILIGFLLNLYTIWTFCGHRICPMFFKHDNELVFDDNAQKIYIRWNGLTKQSTIRYHEFARLYDEETTNKKYAILFIATNAKHYRFNKYLSDIEHAKEFVSAVNKWWFVDRLKENKDRARVYKNVIINKSKKEEKEEIYVSSEEELNTLIKKLKYKSFAEKDIENACKLKEFFHSKYKRKMIEEYENIKIDLENKRNAKAQKSEEVIFKNENKYIAQALLLKVETLDELMKQRENKKKDKIAFITDDDKNEEEDEQQANANHIAF